MGSYYIHLENGTDAGAGTALDPWRTVQKFHDTVLASAGPHTVYIAGAAAVPNVDFTFSGQPPADKPTHYTQWPGQAAAVLTIDAFLGNNSANHLLSDLTTFSTTSNGCFFGGNAWNCAFLADAPNFAVRSNSFRQSLTGCYIKPRINVNRPGIIKNCIIDWSDGPFGGTDYLILGTAQVTGCLLIYGRSSGIGYFLNAGSSDLEFVGNTVVSPNGGSLVFYSNRGLFQDNVFLNIAGGSVQSENVAGARCVGNRMVGYTRIGNSVTDLGDNVVLSESPYRDWQNLDFTVVKPDLLEVAQSFPEFPTTTPAWRRYAGCFGPSGGGISWPLIRRIAAMGDLRFSPSGATF